MGRKVNPHGARLGFNKHWSSQWFATKSMAAYIQEDAVIRGIVEKLFPRSGIDRVEIARSRGEVIVSVHTAKLGVVIRRSGAGIQELRTNLEKALSKGKTEKPLIRINVQEVKQPELSARVVGENIAGQIERRISVKRAIRQAMERTMERGAKGIKIRVSGRIGGAEIARSEVVSSGSIPLQTLRSDIAYCHTEAKTTYGVIGIKVWVYLGESDQLPAEATEAAPRQQSNNRGGDRSDRRPQRGGDRPGGDRRPRRTPVTKAASHVA